MNGKDSVMFSRKSDEWETPLWLFDLLDREFGFDCDVAATRENSKCALFMQDAFSLPVWCGYDDHFWDDDDCDLYVSKFFLNPPHSKIAAFIKKAYEESLKGAVVVCLIPCRTDTRYWHEYVMKAHEVRFIMGRLKFGDSKNLAPFPSCVVVFDHSKYDKNNDPLFSTIPNHKTD